MNHWLTAPVLIPLLGGILQTFMGYAPIALRRTLALATTVLLVATSLVLLTMADDGRDSIEADHLKGELESLGLETVSR